MEQEEIKPDYVVLEWNERDDNKADLLRGGEFEDEDELHFASYEDAEDYVAGNRGWGGYIYHYINLNE